MNWTALVYGGPMLMVCVWWIISARKWFKGPKVNIEHMMLGRGENVLEGMAAAAELEGKAAAAELAAGSEEGESDVKRVRSVDK